MYQLILHHHYTLGSTFDVSTFGNHGQPHLVTAGTATFASSLHFHQSDSRITVAPSQSLNNPFAIAAMVRFYVDGTMTARLNLIEGFMSFSLFIEPTGALTGTIVDANNAWTGTTSPASLVKPGAWHEAWLTHDGISQLTLQCDGTTVAVARNVYGPVRSVGNRGVAIGNWPDRGQYPFAGYIDEVKLYRYDPSKDFQNLLNPCCFDGKAFDAILAELKANKVLNAGGGYWQLLQQLARLIALLRGNTVDGTRSVNQIGQGLYRALQARDSATFAQLQGQLAKMAPTDAASAKQISTLESGIKGILDKAGVSSDLLTRLTAAMCLQAPTANSTDGGKR